VAPAAGELAAAPEATRYEVPYKDARAAIVEEFEREYLRG